MTQLVDDDVKDEDPFDDIPNSDSDSDDESEVDEIVDELYLSVDDEARLGICDSDMSTSSASVLNIPPSPLCLP